MGAKRMANRTSFLSTLPAWGATLVGIFLIPLIVHFYPRSPRGERPEITAAYEPINQFLSTLPAWGATQ